jgi:hypothetical protein
MVTREHNLESTYTEHQREEDIWPQTLNSIVNPNVFVQKLEALLKNPFFYFSHVWQVFFVSWEMAQFDTILMEEWNLFKSYFY